MKQTDFNNHDDDALSRLLGEWRVEEPLPPRFQENVWRRIEKRETRPASGQSWTDGLALLFARPAFATAMATVLLVAGLAAGLWRANQDTARWEAELAQSYVASVNPYAVERP